MAKYYNHVKIEILAVPQVKCAGGFGLSPDSSPLPGGAGLGSLIPMAAKYMVYNGL
jgi:hypothetical protein